MRHRYYMENTPPALQRQALRFRPAHPNGLQTNDPQHEIIGKMR